jgi:hypothetical protein
VLPVIVKAEEDQQRKNARKEKELLTLQKLATAKRSSRIASKLTGKRGSKRPPRQTAKGELR